VVQRAKNVTFVTRLSAAFALSVLALSALAGTSACASTAPDYEGGGRAPADGDAHADSALARTMMPLAELLKKLFGLLF
jgi:hypothetical protein